MSDRLSCTDQELDAIQKVEYQEFLESVGPWADVTKTDRYWKLTDMHREEWAIRIASRKKLEKAAEKAADAEESEAA